MPSVLVECSRGVAGPHYEHRGSASAREVQKRHADQACPFSELDASALAVFHLPAGLGK